MVPSGHGQARFVHDTGEQTCQTQHYCRGNAPTLADSTMFVATIAAYKVSHLALRFSHARFIGALTTVWVADNISC